MKDIIENAYTSMLAGIARYNNKNEIISENEYGCRITIEFIENSPFSCIVRYADGCKAWYLNGQRHRTDGPAVEFADGDKEWWVNDKETKVL